jgi:small subunit ribosomal protein S6
VKIIGIIQEVKNLKIYQTIVVIDSLLKSEEIDAIIEKILRIVNNNGGKVTNVNRWEKKRLAYEIKKRQYGYYVEIDFEAPGNLVKILERDYRLDENILRYVTVHLDKKAIVHLEKQKLTDKEKIEEEELELEEIIDELDEEADIEFTSAESPEQLSTN